MDHEPREARNLRHAAGHRDLELSRATVFLVLRDSPRISKATRERALDALKRQGYVYNRHAAGLRSNRTQTVGVVVNDLGNPYFTMLVRAVEASLSTLAS